MKVFGPYHYPAFVNTTGLPFYERYAAAATNPLSHKDWKKVVEGFNDRIAKEVTLQRNGVSLPHFLGMITMVSVEPSTRRTAVRYYAGTNTDSEFPNMGTGGLVCKLLYSTFNEKYLKEERKLWSFKPCRLMTRNASRMYRLQWDKYMYLSKASKISYEYRKYRQEEQLSKIDTEKYNPLEV